MAVVPPNALFSALSFIGFILAATPLPWHLQSWNIGTCLYMIWTSFGCLILFVNSVVWNTNVINWAPVWCDISSRYIIGASVGIPASSLCITRRLYCIISSKADQKRRGVIIDLSIGIGLPVFVMALEYVVQGHRFNIIEEVGCYPATVNTIATYFVVYMWPLLLGAISMTFSALTIRRTLQHKALLKTMLYADSTMSPGRYWRLMGLCAVEIIFTIPISLYTIVTNTHFYPPAPYVSWEWVHSNFSAVDQFPSVIWRNIPLMAIAVEMTRWLFVFCAFIIFAFFGCTEEARYHYRRAFWHICRIFGYCQSIESLPSTKPRRITITSNGSHPLYVDPNAFLTRVKCHSVESFIAAPPEELSDFASTKRSGSDWTSENPADSPTLGPERPRQFTHAFWSDMPAEPEPAFTLGGRRDSQTVLSPTTPQFV